MVGESGLCCGCVCWADPPEADRFLGDEALRMTVVVGEMGCAVTPWASDCRRGWILASARKTKVRHQKDEGEVRLLLVALEEVSGYFHLAEVLG